MYDHMSLAIRSLLQESLPNTFKWRGVGLCGLFIGEHSFRFEPSKTTPGSTTFVHGEVFSGALSFLMTPALGLSKKTEAGFQGFKRDLKARMESRK